MHSSASSGVNWLPLNISVISISLHLDFVCGLWVCNLVLDWELVRMSSGPVELVLVPFSSSPETRTLHWWYFHWNESLSCSQQLSGSCLEFDNSWLHPSQGSYTATMISEGHSMDFVVCSDKNDISNVDRIGRELFRSCFSSWIRCSHHPPHHAAVGGLNCHWIRWISAFSVIIFQSRLLKALSILTKLVPLSL